MLILSANFGAMLILDQGVGNGINHWPRQVCCGLPGTCSVVHFRASFGSIMHFYRVNCVDNPRQRGICFFLNTLVTVRVIWYDRSEVVGSIKLKNPFQGISSGEKKRF